MRETGLPFDDIKDLVSNLPAQDNDAARHTSAQLDDAGVSGTDHMRTLCEWYSKWSGRSPAVHRGVVTLFGGTHALDNAMSDGSAGSGILNQVTDLSAGSAILNRLCHQLDLGLKVFDLALQLPVADITQEAGLDEKACAGTIAFGMEAIAGGSDLLCVSAIEPKVSYSAIAILCVLHDLDTKELAGAYELEQANLDAALALALPHKRNPLEVLRRLGGRETAAICGAILAARSQHIPVVLDSYAGFAAASVLNAMNPDAISHCVFAQKYSALGEGVYQSLGIETLFASSVSDQAINGVAMGAGVVKSSCLALQGRN